MYLEYTYSKGLNLMCNNLHVPGSRPNLYGHTKFWESGQDVTDDQKNAPYIKSAGTGGGNGRGIFSPPPPPQPHPSPLFCKKRLHIGAGFFLLTPYDSINIYLAVSLINAAILLFINEQTLICISQLQGGSSSYSTIS